jgi:alkylhydroperoxidase family enzyme
MDQVERAFGVIHAGTGIFAYCPPILQASNGLGRAIAQSGTVAPLLRSLASLRVAHVAGCPFRIDSLAAACKDAGASDAQIEAITGSEGGSPSALFSETESAALQLAEAMTGTPAEVSDEVFSQARVCFTDPELVELAATIAAENYRVRFNRAFGVESIGMYPLPDRPQ